MTENQTTRWMIGMWLGFAVVWALAGQFHLAAMWATFVAVFSGVLIYRRLRGADDA